MSKTCSFCNEKKELNEFSIKVKKTGQLDSRCKKCHNKITRERRREKKKFIKSIMNKECQECGFNDTRCLNNCLGKGRAKGLLSCNNKTIEEEIKNALVLCCNCVSIKLYKENKIKFDNKELSKKKGSIRTRNLRRNTQEYINNIKKSGCIKCKLKNEQYPCIFHFDHIDKKNKVNNVGRLSKDSIHRVKEEIKYCQLLCANCHKIKTLEENDSLSNVIKIRQVKDNRRKLTNKMISEIKILLKDNKLTQREIADKYNVDQTLISYYNKKK